MILSSLEFERIVLEYSDTVARLCLVRMKNRFDAEDCYQNVFLKLYKKAPRFENEEHIKAWLIRVAINECNSLFKSVWKRKNVSSADIIAPYIEDYQKDLYNSVMELPNIYREVIYLFYYESYKVKEISELLGRSENTIKSQLLRARKLLKTEIEENI